MAANENIPAATAAACGAATLFQLSGRLMTGVLRDLFRLQEVTLSLLFLCSLTLLIPMNVDKSTVDFWHQNV